MPFEIPIWVVIDDDYRHGYSATPFMAEKAAQDHLDALVEDYAESWKLDKAVLIENEEYQPGEFFNAEEIGYVHIDKHVLYKDPPKLNTPGCLECHSNEQWTIGRKLDERKTWNPHTQLFVDEYVECTDLWVFCGGCNFVAYPDDEIYKLLESQE